MSSAPGNSAGRTRGESIGFPDETGSFDTMLCKGRAVQGTALTVRPRESLQTLIAVTTLVKGLIR
jgi:hypothetical protein